MINPKLKNLVQFMVERKDGMTHNDEQDLTHMIKVISTTLAVTATRRVSSGTIDVPTMQGSGSDL